MFSDKTKSSEKTVLVGDQSFTQEAKKPEILNIFFSNIEKLTAIQQLQKVNPFADKSSHLIFKVIFKCSKNLRSFALSNVRDSDHFNFQVLVLMMMIY